MDAMDGYRSDVGFLYELFLRLKETSPSVKACGKGDRRLYGLK
jgi:hypothetical protein